MPTGFAAGFLALELVGARGGLRLELAPPVRGGTGGEPRPLEEDEGRDELVDGGFAGRFGSRPPTVGYEAVVVRRRGAGGGAPGRSDPKRRAPPRAFGTPTSSSRKVTSSFLR